MNISMHAVDADRNRGDRGHFPLTARKPTDRQEWRHGCFVLTRVSSVLWHCWLGHLTRKKPVPIWPVILCWWDVKPYSIIVLTRGHAVLKKMFRRTGSKWRLHRIWRRCGPVVVLLRLPVEVYIDRQFDVEEHLARSFSLFKIIEYRVFVPVYMQ